jgi:hypothetical protein
MCIPYIFNEISEPFMIEEVIKRNRNPYPKTRQLHHVYIRFPKTNIRFRRGARVTMIKIFDVWQDHSTFQSLPVATVV